MEGTPIKIIGRVYSTEDVEEVEWANVNNKPFSSFGETIQVDEDGVANVDPDLQGEDGKSAYESAQDGGYLGTESQFNADLASIGTIAGSQEELLLPADSLLDVETQLVRDGSGKGIGAGSYWSLTAPGIAGNSVEKILSFPGYSEASTTWTNNRVINADTGVETSSTKYKTSGYLTAFKGIVAYFITGDNAEKAGMTFYDSNYNFISGHYINDKTVISVTFESPDVPENAAFFRVSWYNDLWQGYGLPAWTALPLHIDCFKINLQSGSFGISEKLSSDDVGKNITIEFEAKGSQKLNLYFNKETPKSVLLQGDWLKFSITDSLGELSVENNILFQLDCPGTFLIKNVRIIANNSVYSRINELEAKQEKAQQELFYYKKAYTYSLPSCFSKLVNILNEDVVLNIAHFGDSIVQGVLQEDAIMQNYTKYFARKMWQKYGYAGLGWTDFSLAAGLPTVCADDEQVVISRSGNISYVDKNPASLGICGCHSVFSAGASITVTINKETDKAVVWFYGNAKFNVAVNNGTPQSVSGIAGNGWQSVTLTNGNMQKITITATAQSVIFGADLSYGNRGVKIHKLGNAGLKTTNIIEQNEDSWKDGLSKLNLDAMIYSLGANDVLIQLSYDDILDNNKIIYNRIIDVYPLIDFVFMKYPTFKGDINSYDYPGNGKSYLDVLSDQAYEYNRPFIELNNVFGSSEQVRAFGLGYDGLHPTKKGCNIIANHLFRLLFNDFSL